MSIGIGNFIGLCILLLIIGFAAGALVYRNNFRKAEDALKSTVAELDALKKRVWNR